ncbi:MAG: hypothetical protein E7310_00470 [Clostridiales bacterium]|nr:hypothetical protein [Clostridiales bacterium]
MLFTLGAPTAFATDMNVQQSTDVESAEMVARIIFERLSDKVESIRGIFKQCFDFFELLIKFLSVSMSPEKYETKIAITWKVYDFTIDGWISIVDFYDYGEEITPYYISTEKPVESDKYDMSLTATYFKGWSPEVQHIATEDVTYTAQYVNVF